jgi:hypothetical protein
LRRKCLLSIWPIVLVFSKNGLTFNQPILKKIPVLSWVYRCFYNENK